MRGVYVLVALTMALGLNTPVQDVSPKAETTVYLDVVTAANEIQQVYEAQEAPIAPVEELVAIQSDDRIEVESIKVELLEAKAEAEVRAMVAKQVDGMEKEVIVLARVIHNEARGVKSETEQACVGWTVLNRVDKKMRGDTIIECATAKHQFAYNKHTKPNAQSVKVSRDVITRWLLEKYGIKDVGRVLPKKFTYFAAHDGHNWFRAKYKTHDYWDYDLTSPYKN
jgi:hypothetical protein